MTQAIPSFLKALTVFLETRWQLIVVAIVALTLAGGVATCHDRSSLSAAQADVTTARKALAAAIDSAQAAQVARAAALLRADSAERHADSTERHADSIDGRFYARAAGIAPACVPLAAVGDSAISADHAVISDLRLVVRVDSTVLVKDSSALRNVIIAGSRLDTASGQLVRVSHPSFLSRIAPKVGVGAAAGITPAGKFGVVGGLTLGWHF